MTIIMIITMVIIMMSIMAIMIIMSTITNGDHHDGQTIITSGQKP